MKKIEGRVLKYGDNINTDIISPPQYMELDIPQAAVHAMEVLDSGFSSRVKPGDILVAGKNFGSGSSRETSPLTLKYLGVGAIVAEFFARIFYRNAINVGIPVVECSKACRIRESDRIQLDLENGIIYNLSRQEQYECSRLPDHIMEIIEKGGLKNFLAEQFREMKDERI
ncbi:3-isopropylmalate dehydratase [Enterocloster bolteae]|uniref:LeuD/DmdB family oxidoreductase small subunit n=1 Tax=Enterocloster bolteae TaxID=208479 RepID=UPI00210D357C|nr:3-isopropylmalate dehydratase [Enterocloster bolteae]MCQ5146234.1 3-isopropylmalate dehydratase [Enterocloster bolteae]